MKKNKDLFAFLLFFLFSSPLYALWDSTCLDTCFRTGHDCNYCNYQCSVEETYYLKPNYSGDTVCPFYGYPNYDNGYDDEY